MSSELQMFATSISGGAIWWMLTR